MTTPTTYEELDRESGGSWEKNEAGEWVLNTADTEELQDELLEHMDKLNSVGVVYERADSILTAQNVSVTVVNDKAMDCSAMNDGKTIIFNADLIEDINDETIVSMHGLNYHEVAHILYTPRENSLIGKFVTENRLMRAYNILEDSRIENMISAKYPSTKPFLEATMTEIISRSNPSDWGDLFILTTGRKYLDLEIRQEIANRHIAKHGVGVSEILFDIIHAYRTLSFPTDNDKAIELIARFSEYVGIDDEPPTYKEPEGGHGKRELMDSGRVKSGKEQKEVQDKADKVTDNSSEKLEGGTDKADGTPPDSSTDDSDDSENAPTEDNPIDQQLKDKLNSRIESIMQSEEVKRDTAEIRKAIYENDTVRSALKQSTFTVMPAPTAIRTSADQFGRELERIRIENDPAWHIEQPSGRLNVTRAMHSDINDIDKVFDRWELGNDSNDIEAVILLDHSGSMNSRMTSTCESAWAIKRGIETIDGRVTVFKFNHKSRLLYSADDIAKPNDYRWVTSSGTTNPINSLLEAERILSNSNRGVKILFIVTDGEWESTELNNSAIARIKDLGAITSVVYIGDLSWYKEQYDRETFDNMIKGYQHGADTFRAIATPSDLVDVASDLVKSALSRSRY